MMRTKKLRPVTRLAHLGGILVLVLGVSLALKAGLSGAALQAGSQCHQAATLAGSGHQAAAAAEMPPVQRLLLIGLVSLLVLRSYNRHFRARAIAQCRSVKRLYRRGRPVPGRGSMTQRRPG